MPDAMPLVFRWPLGMPATLLVGAAAVALTVWLHARARPWRLGAAALLTLRLVAVGCVLILLAGPSVREPGPASTRLPPLMILADASASMATPDVGGRSRWQAIQPWLDPQRLERWRDRAALQLSAFAERSAPMSADARPDGGATRLFDALAAIGDSGGVPGTIVVLSDGHDTRADADPESVGRQLQRRGWRVLAVPVGEPGSQPAVDLQVHAAREHVFRGETTRLQVHISASGIAPRALELRLHEENAIIDSRRIELDDQGVARIDLPVTPRLDPASSSAVVGYRVEARPVDQSLQWSDEAWAFVGVSRRRLRVALIEGEPYWDSRFLADHLRSDPFVELTSYVGVGGERRLVQGESPRGPFSVAGFDVVVLGKGVQTLMDEAIAARLADFVLSGGSLVLARGEPADGTTPRGRAVLAALDPVLPVDWGRRTLRDLSLQLAQAGGEALFEDQARQWGASVTRLPEMIAATLVERTRAASIVAMTQTPAGGAPMAAVVHQQVGRGRVFAVLTDGLWRWRFGATEAEEGPGAFGRFWSSALRWASGGDSGLLPGNRWSLTADRLTLEAGEPVRIEVASRGPAPSEAVALDHVAPGQAPSRLLTTQAAPDVARFVTTLTPQVPGVHVLRVAGIDPDAANELRVAVRPADRERRSTAARPRTLAALAEASGGRCVGIEDTDAVDAMLDEAVALMQTPPRLAYRLDHPLILVPFVLALSIEWILRRRGGLA